MSGGYNDHRPGKTPWFDKQRTNLWLSNSQQIFCKEICPGGYLVVYFNMARVVGSYWLGEQDAIDLQIASMRADKLMWPEELQITPLIDYMDYTSSRHIEYRS